MQIKFRIKIRQLFCRSEKNRRAYAGKRAIVQAAADLNIKNKYNSS